MAARRERDRGPTALPNAPLSRRRAASLALLVALAPLLAVGCGGGGGDAPTQPADAPAFPASDFPKAHGQTLTQIVRSNHPERANVVVTPTGRVFNRGNNRFGFGVFTPAREQVTNAHVAIYAAPSGGGKAVGPFPARVESLATKPEFTAKTTRNDPDAAKDVYVTNLKLDRDGNWDLLAMLKGSNGYSATLMPSIRVGGFTDIPAVGERPPRIHTPTAADVNGDLSKIDTRIPPDDMHDVDFADVLGKKPVVLLFATPALCQSRVCGPVVDAAEEVKSEVGDGVAFIHMEVYNHNNASEGLRPQLRAFGLETEPWLFVIDRKGIMSTRIEGAFSPAELHDAVHRVTR